MEAVGAASGVLQVAEIGFSLAKTLYEYAASVRDAEKEIKKIARDVKLTSKVLRRTHEQIKQDRQAQLCTEDALLDLEDVLDGCREAFEEVNSALRKTMKSSISGPPSVPVVRKLRWPLQSSKIEVLRANLEKLKTTLLLMLSVLAYGSKAADHARAEANAELTLEKLQIQNLVRAKDEATHRLEELTKMFTKLEAKLDRTFNEPLASDPLQSIAASTASGLSSDMPGLRRRDNHGLGARLSATFDPSRVDEGLRACASAVSRLAETIASATRAWEVKQSLQYDGICNSLRIVWDETNNLGALDMPPRPCVHSRAAPSSADCRMDWTGDCYSHPSWNSSTPQALLSQSMQVARPDWHGLLVPMSTRTDKRPIRDASPPPRLEREPKRQATRASQPSPYLQPLEPLCRTSYQDVNHLGGSPSYAAASPRRIPSDLEVWPSTCDDAYRLNSINDQRAGSDTQSVPADRIMHVQNAEVLSADHLNAAAGQELNVIQARTPIYGQRSSAVQVADGPPEPLLYWQASEASAETSNDCAELFTFSQHSNAIPTFDHAHSVHSSQGDSTRPDDHRTPAGSTLPTDHSRLRDSVEATDSFWPVDAFDSFCSVTPEEPDSEDDENEVDRLLHRWIKVQS